MQVKTKAEEIKALLAPYITPLTPEQRRALAKMGDKTLAFVEKAHELALINPLFVPPFLNFTGKSKLFSWMAIFSG
jgi:hypothetical protein